MEGHKVTQKVRFDREKKKNIRTNCHIPCETLHVHCAYVCSKYLFVELKQTYLCCLPSALSRNSVSLSSKFSACCDGRSGVAFRPCSTLSSTCRHVSTSLVKQDDCRKVSISILQIARQLGSSVLLGGGGALKGQRHQNRVRQEEISTNVTAILCFCQICMT